MNALDYALEASEPTLAHIEEIYGTRFISVVYAVQRNGLTKFGSTAILADRAAEFLSYSPEPLTYLTILPGRIPLTTFLERRFAAKETFGGWFDLSMSDRQFLSDLQQATERHHLAGEDEPVAAALRELDAESRDIERLYLNGVTYADLAEMLDSTVSAVRTKIIQLQKLGFDLPPRNAFSPRRSR